MDSERDMEEGGIRHEKEAEEEDAAIRFVGMMSRSLVCTICQYRTGISVFYETIGLRLSCGKPDLWDAPILAADCLYAEME